MGMASDLKVAGWRVERLLELGFTAEEASLFLDWRLSWHEAASLIWRGCPPTTALRILCPLDQQPTPLVHIGPHGELVTA